eukprot:TRINITY_DN9049_c0_g1_i1.p1 TRINITY_DN9049_c0_g1~~TRINITY_DN9049_c0_g1_i1.p1  ORF type:complete len:358 (-),score=84.80 TRINITY_DN9049_c0_g1_i1:193-1266(-)
MNAKLFILALLASAVLASDILVLTPDNFDNEVGGDVPALVEFFAPWCGHCKALLPEYESVATSFKGKAVKIAQVDADANKELANKFEVSGYPTLKWFPAKSTTPETYSGERTAAGITQFINEKTGLDVKIKTVPTSVTVLDPTNFDKIVMDPSKAVLVKFYAPWCGHCKQLAPKYVSVANIFADEADVVIAEVDADAHREIGGKYDVHGFPTLKFFPKGADKTPVDYTGGREITDFVAFLNEKAGTERTVSGGYTDVAGRIPELDALVEQFAKKDADKAAIVKETEEKIATLEHKNKQFAKFYVMTMKRVMERPEYVANEAARLNKVIISGSMSKSRKSDFWKRLNILNVFVNAALI